MRDPQGTRETILKKSGVLFNTQGYKATSISDITEATGFTKGAFAGINQIEITKIDGKSAVLTLLDIAMP